MGETKVIYHLDEQDTPYLIKMPLPADRLTLLDLKTALNKPTHKYFFKSVDDDFGVVKEEIVDDQAILPCYNGRVVTWLVAPDGSSVVDVQSQCTDGEASHRVTSSPQEKPTSCVSSTGASSTTAAHSLGPKGVPVTAEIHPNERASHHPMSSRTNGYSRHATGGHRSHLPAQQRSGITAASVLSSDIETTSFMDSDDDASARLSTTTATTNRTSHMGGRRRKKRLRQLPIMSKASSFSSITDSTMSLNIVTVQLNMDSASFLGISIVGQSNKGGDGGIYVGSIMKGGAVALDGRIEPGDMILEVNGVPFENLSNDDAVRSLREAVQRAGPITLIVAKCWDPSPRGYTPATQRPQEPVRPIDPSAWIMHTEAVRRGVGGRGGGMGSALPGAGNWGRMGAPSMSTLTSTSSSLISSLPANEYSRHHPHHYNLQQQHSIATTSSSSHSSKSFSDLNLTKQTDMAAVVRAMAQPDSGLEVRDRMWLKIAIPQAFIGSELVDWLHSHVDGFADRRDARRYACSLLKSGFIEHTVNKFSFSEQSYYIFGTGACSGDFNAMSLDDIDSVSSSGNRDCDSFGPLPSARAWNVPQSNQPFQPALQYPPAGVPSLRQGSYPPTSMNYAPPSAANYAPPMPYGINADTVSYMSMPGVNGAESVASGSTNHGKTCACIVTHTYKQIRRLWDNPEKGCHQRMHGKFDADIERSTSSDTESDDSEGSQTAKNKKKEQGAAEGSSERGGGGGGGGGGSLVRSSHRSEEGQNSHGRGTLDSATSALGARGGTDTSGGSRWPPPPSADRSLPSPPPPHRNLGSDNEEPDGSRRSFRMAMGNTLTEDTLQVMGDL